MSEDTAVKKNLDRILERCLMSILEHQAVEHVSVNEALDKYCRDTYATAKDQVAGLVNAAKEAGISLNEKPSDVDGYSHGIQEMLSRCTEVRLVDKFSKNNASVQEELDQLSHESMPEAIQIHVDQLITTFGIPIPQKAIEDAPALDAEKAAEEERKKPPPTNAADVLRWIRDESKNTQYSTGRMQERWARDFMAGSYGRRAQEMATAKAEGRPMGYNNEGGASYIRIDQSMIHICWNWDRVSMELPDANKLLTAEKLYGAYDSSLDEYWKFISQIARGLRQKGVANVVGSLFCTHLQNHKGSTKTAGDKIIAETRSLDAEKAAKVVKWAEETQSRLDDAIKAAKEQ